MTTRAHSLVIQRSGNATARRLVFKTCPICGTPFKGRSEVKTCDASCTAALRSLSARNRKPTLP